MTKNKKAAIELSIGTIVILVIGMSMLVLGLLLVKNIMCAGMIITEQISSGVQNEVKNLFSANQFGVHCMGEGGQEIKLGTGGRRKVICMVKTEDVAEYQITATDIKSLKGASTTIANSWVLNNEWKGSVPPGADKSTDVLLLDLPRDAPTTTLRITIQAKNLKSGSEDTIVSTIDIVPTGFVQGTIC